MNSGNSLHILHVDDDRFSQQMMTYICEDAGVTVSFASCKASFMAELQLRSPDVILMDAELDGESGLDLACMVDRFDSEIPVIFLTGRDEDSLFENGRPGNVRGHIKKPYIPEEIFDHIQSILRGDEKNSANKGLSQDDMERLKSAYLAGLRRKLPELKRQSQLLLLGLGSISVPQEFVLDVHNVAGMASIHGLIELAQSAMSLESLLRGEYADANVESDARSLLVKEKVSQFLSLVDQACASNLHPI